jgi:ABC-2 type transport system ATP-binding protein
VAERLCDAIFMIHRGRKVLDGTLAEIQQRYPVKTVRFRLAGGATPAGSLPGVAASAYARPFHLATLADGAAPQELLRALAVTDEVEHFEVVRPTLHDIFVAIAGGGAEASN